MSPGDLILMRMSLRPYGRTCAARVLAVSKAGELCRVEVWSERRRTFRKPRWRSRVRVEGDLPPSDRRRKDIERADLAERAEREGTDR